MKLTIVITVMLSFHSAFESGSTDPFLLFPYSRAVQDTSSPVCVVNPALLPCCRGLLLSAAGGKPYYGYGLDSEFSAVQYSGRSYGLSAMWNFFGCDFYRENTFISGAGYAPFRWLSAGAAAGVYMLEIRTEDVSYAETYCDWGAGLAVNPAEWFQAGAFLKNVNSLLDESPALYPEWSCGLLARPCRGLSVSWNITGGPAGRINTFILNVNPLKYISTGFGYSPETTSFSAVLGIVLGRVEFGYGIRIHPYLGYSHAVSISYNGGWDVEPLDYGMLSFSRANRINIRTVTYEELKELGFLSEKSARRIILYRDQVGPLTRDALTAVGMLPGEIKMLLSVSYGFEKESNPGLREKTVSHGRKKKQAYVPRKERVKILFKKMLDEGIPPYQAAIYSDLAESDRSVFLEKLRSDTSLTDEQKKIIMRLCRR